MDPGSGGDGGSCRAQQPEEVGVICGARSWPKSSRKELVGEPKIGLGSAEYGSRGNKAKTSRSPEPTPGIVK